MVDFGSGIRLIRGNSAETVSGFTRLTTVLDAGEDGATLVDLAMDAPGPATVEWLAPFSWDAGQRGVHIRQRVLEGRMCLHTGAYGTADAAAHRDGVPMVFRVNGDGHRYLIDDRSEPGLDGDHQDAAGWVLVDTGGRCLVLAWEYSASMIIELTTGKDELRVRCLLPTDTFHPSADSSVWGGLGPDAWLAAPPGDVDDGARALRSFIAENVVTPPDLGGLPRQVEFPCLVGNSWGVAEDISAARIRRMMAATAAVGAEVFVVDKGWERSVGDWHPKSDFTAGLAPLSRHARELGMGFGVWCGFGNADPRSPVATEHPDWLTTWRGHRPRLSFDNHALCLGHDPARDWVLEELRRMVTEFELTWLLHDFESISRCDAEHHSHDPGAGEYAAEAAWHHILRTLRAEFGHIVLENCWNGGRPLDLAMLRSHHTTITEDHCQLRWNSPAKIALGRYLPLDWQSAYMGAEDLPARARIAPYVIGGPWVLMDDQARWSADEQHLLARATEIFRAWRGELRLAEIDRPQVDQPEAYAIRARTPSGRTMLAISSPVGCREVVVDLEPGNWRLTDAWTGEDQEVGLTDGRLRLVCAPEGDGILISLDRPPVATGDRTSPRRDRS